ncbi:hypothetical protein JG688_00007523 [Phytophthora aleatoria]|uniref:Uncharacterized protein n=1 Tax=Phytophthora aleatoria TaxID=2496075 RepID=A0A8J5M806_9STRA|nr:hypothetical protein JG688_00007523 [Phytophthora aleatoria]
MPGGKRHVAALAGEKEALGANWKSAQCVTSLYDSYIQVQKENEQLREDVRRLEQSELLAKIKEPEDTKGDELEQEIRLLRSEKLRMEETHRLELQKLETRAASSETQHQQLVAKYHERFEFDPLEAKRAAMAVKTMQNTLQNVVLEKEEIGIRYGELKEQYRKFHNEQVDIVRNLKQQVKTLEQQRVKNGQQRVVNSLANWSTNKVQNAWSKWIELTKEKRRYEENKQVMATLERKVDDRVAKVQYTEFFKWLSPPRVYLQSTDEYSSLKRSSTVKFAATMMIFEMLRNCRDRVRARLPEKFIKLFKQNKNWRKYYALIERKATELENKLRDVLEEREQLIQSKSELHKRHQLVKDKLESSQQNTKNVSKLVTDWKKKLVKWQQELDEKDQAIAEKTSELEKVATEFERYRLIVAS